MIRFLCLTLFLCLRFKNCLKLEGSVTSRIIGHVFFDVVNTPCFEAREEVVCLRRVWWGPCIERGVRRSLQWRDLTWS